MNIKDVRAKIIQSGVLEEAVAGKSKQFLLTEYKSLFDEEVVDEGILGELKSDEYTTDEDGQKHPNLRGLDRLFREKYPICLHQGPEQMPQVMIYPNGGLVSAVLYNIKYVNDNGDINSVSASADCYMGNTNPPYFVYTTAVAESRARSRVLRIILGISNISAEEIGRSDIEEIQNIVSPQQTSLKEMPKSEDVIHPTQISTIQVCCTRNGINLEKFLAKYAIGKSLSQLTVAQGAELMVQINKFQTNHEEVPDDIKIS